VRFFVLLASLLAISSVGADQQAVSALSLLNKMGDAIKNSNYFGTLVYMHDGHVESLKIVHKKDENGEFQRLVHLTGAAREVIRKNDVVTCYMPDSQSVFVGERRFNNHLLARLSKNFQEFTSQYNFEIDGSGRVAGREATIVAIRPKDNYRYGYHFWIDNDSHLLLKSDLVDASKKVLEQLMFVEINVGGNITQEMLVPAMDGKSFTWHKGNDNASQEKTEGFPAWKINNLPYGFAIKDRAKQKMPNSNQLVDYLFVSDGLATISVYIEKFGVENKGYVGSSQMGAVSIFGSLLDDYHVTVVGEAPQSTVKMIAESITLH
jgi:sigma-E factor negative regulatory protein RseB